MTKPRLIVVKLLLMRVESQHDRHDSYFRMYKMRPFGDGQKQREAQLIQSLCEFARFGKPIYGGSTGVAILGRSIETIAYLDPNEVGITDMMGLDLLDSDAVRVHYDEKIWAFVEGVETAVIVIPERSGVITSRHGQILLENVKMNYRQIEEINKTYDRGK